MSPTIELLLRNVRIVTCTDDACTITPPAFLAVFGGLIAGLGPMSQLDPAARANSARASSMRSSFASKSPRTAGSRW